MACNGFLGKTSFQWRLQNSISEKEAEENVQQHHRSDESELMETLDG